MEAKVPAPYTRTPNDRPNSAAAARVVATPCVLLVLGAACFVAGWVAPGVVLCVLAVLVVLAEVAVGWVVVKYALRRHANMFSLAGPLLKDAMPPAVRSEVPRGADAAVERHEREVDRAVGFGLTRSAAEGGLFSGARDREAADALRDRTLEERAATYAWIQGAPAWERVALTADDGVRLVARALVADPASPRWAVLCHGYGGSWDSMLQYARRWAEAGYNLLVPSLRAHGDSEGPFIGTGWLDRRDVVAWCRWLAEREGSAASIVLFGHSMGASSVCLAAGEPDLPPQVRAAVSDCAFDSSWHALSSVLELAGAPVHPTLDLVRLYLMVRPGGYDLACGDVTAALGRTRLPVLFVHGAHDPIVRPELAPLLYEASAGEKEILLVEDAGHCQSSLADPDLYWDRVLGFAERYAGERDAR